MEDEGLTRQKIIIRFRLSHNDWHTAEDENDATRLAMRLDSVLTEDGRAEINGFEFMAGWIDILIFGSETDEDTNAIYETVAPIFRAYPCLEGSHIVRLYGNLGEVTKVSDTI